MKKFFKIDFETILIFVCIVLIGIYAIIMTALNNKLVLENNKLKEEKATLETEIKDQHDTIIERNQELMDERFENEEWKRLFFSVIGFYPDESYPYK